MAAPAPTPQPVTAPGTKQNIFTSPLTKPAQGRINKDIELKKKNYRKGLLFLFVSAVFLGVYSFMFLYPQVQDYLNFEQRIHDVEGQIENYAVTLSDLEKNRDFHKAAYDEEFKEEQEIIDVVFPETADKLGVIRLMENFATHLSTSFPPFDFNSITFQGTRKEKGYRVLPFQTSIKASKANFERFLGLINLSGDISQENPDHVRLMEISNISLRYLGTDSSGRDQGVNFTVKLAAYSR